MSRSGRVHLRVCHDLALRNHFDDTEGLTPTLIGTEHIIALEAMDKGLVGTLLRYPYEVRDPAEYFDEIRVVKVTKDMLDLARHIVEQKSGSVEPGKFEDQYETALSSTSSTRSALALRSHRRSGRAARTLSI
jgi:non-homologous end joining protein Ku